MIVGDPIKTEDEAKLFLLSYVQRVLPDECNDASIAAITTGFIMGMEFAFAVPEYARALHSLLPQHGVEREANIAKRAADLFPVEVAHGVA